MKHRDQSAWSYLFAVIRGFLRMRWLGCLVLVTLASSCSTPRLQRSSLPIQSDSAWYVVAHRDSVTADSISRYRGEIIEDVATAFLAELVFVAVQSITKR